MMATIHVFLCSLAILLWSFSHCSGTEQLNVTCLASSECILPCNFSSDGQGARIMWYRKKAVVSCTRYGNTSFVVGHNSAVARYMNRTSLFADHVLEGNATLVLRNVTPQDQGKYFCITMKRLGSEESGIIVLNVKAPVQDISMELNDEAVFCRADGIYPEPTLVWSTDPPTGDGLFYNKTKMEQTQLGFYEVESWVPLKAAESINLEFICDVSNEMNTRRARFKQEAPIQTSSHSEIKIPCSFPGDVDTFDLIWRIHFSEHILSMNVSGMHHHLTISKDWKIHVLDGRSAWRHLKLPNVVPDHQGTYTCEVRTSQVTYITQTDVIVIPDSNPLLAVYVTLGVLGFLMSVSFGSLGILGFKVGKLNQKMQPM
ncbi:V-set domain-containing T-cell activation inhibitor 1-like [Syngnathus acus]|uniref:V-set domain-containing T-cell activation inhibitor 1-like n=1 Tax=Syngnathus acus TaxID=161584 RepID=UPI001885AF91|nr:V-set domain-containing T-cell activation inhibitor 1-like [Syngnathus acus]